MSTDTRDSKGKFLPGISGNPDGRPRKKLAITEGLARMVTDSDVEDLWRPYIERAKGGDIQAMQLVCGYLQGRPSQTIIHEGNTSSDMLNEFRDLMDAATALHRQDDESNEDAA